MIHIRWLLHSSSHFVSSRCTFSIHSSIMSTHSFHKRILLKCFIIALFLFILVFFWKASILGLCESITRRETCVVKVTVCIHVYFCRCVARLPLYRASLWFADAGRSSARRPLACKLWIGSWVQWISCWWRRMTGCRNRCPVWSMTTGTWRINFTV